MEDGKPIISRGSLRNNNNSNSSNNSNNSSTQKKSGGLSYTEFLTFLCDIALEGMNYEHFHKLFPSPFNKIHALLTIWGIADIHKLEDAMMLHVDLVI